MHSSWRSLVSTQSMKLGQDMNDIHEADTFSQPMGVTLGLGCHVSRSCWNVNDQLDTERLWNYLHTDEANACCWVVVLPFSKERRATPTSKRKKKEGQSQDEEGRPNPTPRKGGEGRPADGSKV